MNFILKSLSYDHLRIPPSSVLLSKSNLRPHLPLQTNAMNTTCPCKLAGKPSIPTVKDAPSVPKRIISTPNAPKPVGPYNQAVALDKTLYVSGCLGLNKDTMKLVGGGAVNEARQALTSLGHILKAAGSSYANVLKTTIFLADIGDFAAVNEVYKEFFFGDYPARSCFQVGKLPMGAKVEIEAIAGLP